MKHIPYTDDNSLSAGQEFSAFIQSEG